MVIKMKVIKELVVDIFKNMKLIHILYGGIIGVANIIPGVSGGTMAVILNVYDQIIEAVSGLVTKKIKDSIIFLLPIGIGGGIGIILFSKIIEFCLESIPNITNLAFVGLIVGSIPMIAKKIENKRFKFSTVFSFIVMFGIMIAMLILQSGEGNGTLITELTLGSFVMLFVCSAIAAATMIIPGISGSFVMLLLGVYTSVLTAISSFNIPVLIPVGLGCIAGVVGCAKLIEKLFEKFPEQTYAGILGLMVGSVLIICPAFALDLTTAIGVVVAVIMGYVAYYFSKN